MSQKPEAKSSKLQFKAVKHLEVKSGLRAGLATALDTQFHTSSKNANNGEGWQYSDR